MSERRDEAIAGFMESVGFCGCGLPDDAFEYILSGMQLLRDLKAKVWEKTEPYESWAARCKEHFGSDGAAYFFWYWLHKEGLSEHGGSVPGWLSDKGTALRAALEEIAAMPQESQ